MSEENQFLVLLERLRSGDPEAAREIFDRYEPHIRRVARSRLRDPRLRRILDSGDIGQSVMKSFFLRAAMGQLEPNSPDELMKLLAAMVRNKVIDKGRRASAEKRGGNRVHTSLEDGPVASPEPTPSEVISERELVEEAKRRLSADERALYEMRSEGHEWIAIAEKLGGTPDWLAIATRDKISIWDLKTYHPVTTLAIPRQLVTFSPDGHWLLTYGADPLARLWDTETWALRHRLEGHGEGIQSVAFTPDGRRLATGSRDKTVRIWDTETWVSLWTFAAEQHFPWLTLAFDPDCKRLYAADDGGIVAAPPRSPVPPTR